MAETVQYRCGVKSKLKDNADHITVLTFCEALRECEDLLGILRPDEPNQVLEGLLAPLILLKWQALRWGGPLPWPATPYLHLHIGNLLLNLLRSREHSKGQGFSGNFPLLILLVGHALPLEWSSRTVTVSPPAHK